MGIFDESSPILTQNAPMYDKNNKMTPLWMSYFRKLVQKDTLTALWPVGSVHIRTDSKDPADVFGFGKWERISKGRVLVGVDEDDSDFSSNGKTGGSKKAVHDKNHTGTAVADHPSLTHTVTQPEAHTAHTTSQVQTGTGTTVVTLGTHDHNHTGTAVAPHPVLTHTVTQPDPHSDHNIMNPYETVYIWKRVS